MPDGSIPPIGAVSRALGLPIGANNSHVIVVGNEKGGAGKSTVSMHVCVALAKCGLEVGVMDLDVRQRTLTRYFENREKWVLNAGISHLPSPMIKEVQPSMVRDKVEAHAEERDSFHKQLINLRKLCDIVVIDAPGSYTNLSRCAHGIADTILTPMNDSFVDFDLLADIDMQTLRISDPSLYADMVRDCRKEKARNAAKPIDWVVLRNRLSPLKNRNNVNLEAALIDLSERINFRLATGLSERVIYRELFVNGLTLLDIDNQGPTSLNMSHVAARQELRDLIGALNLPILADTPLGF